MSRVTYPGMAVLVVLAEPWIAVGQKPEESPVEIRSPKPDAEVDHIEFVEGRIKKPGHPVVMVMPLAGDQPWYAQDLIEGVGSNGDFTARSHIGEEKVMRTIKFRIVVLVVKDEKEANAKYPPGTQFKNLPVDVPKSEIITVVRKPE